VHERFYFEEQRKYVAQLCSRDWCGSQPANDQDLRLHIAERRNTPKRRQPLMPRRTLSARNFGTEPWSQTNAGPSPGLRLLSLLDSLGTHEREDASPCPSWLGNVGSCSERADLASEADDASSKGGDNQKCEEQCMAAQTRFCERERACGSTATPFSGDGHGTSAFPGEGEAASHAGGWIGGPGTYSEPGSRRRYRNSHHSVPETRHEVRESHEPASLAALSGKWQVAEGADKGMDAGVWTIEDDGKAFFNGKRFGNDYDIFAQKQQEGNTVIQRGDGWTVQTDSLGSDELVWTKDGELGNVTWKRKVTASGLKCDSKTSVEESQMELRSKMQASAQQMSDGWGSTGRLSSALAVIEEIPMRISEDMQRAASYVVDNMQTEVAAVSKQIRGSGWGCASETQDGESKSKTAAEKVIKNLEVIPTMVQNLLEARVQKARDKVRHRVHGMIQNLSVIKEENWEDHEAQLVSQMRLISEEVEKIAGDAVKAAAQECHAHALRQLDFALHTLRDQNEVGRALVTNQCKEEDARGNSGRWEVTHDPEFWPKTVADANFAKDTMEQAVAVVQDKDYIPQSITNQVVADELLRARIRSGGAGCHRGAMTVSRVQSSRGGAAPLLCSNPGSRGHPDFCPRPCVYHAQGRCQNGNECMFCHMPHPKRPVRFDKQHRDELKKMSFVQLNLVVLPILRQKARDLVFTPDVAELLEHLWPALELQTVATVATVAPSPEMAIDSPAHDSGGNHRAGHVGPAAGSAQSVSARSAGFSSNASITGSERSSRQRSAFSGAFHIMGFRSLLAMLASKVPKDALDLRDTVESVLQKTRGEVRVTVGSSLAGSVSELAIQETTSVTRPDAERGTASSSQHTWHRGSKRRISRGRDRTGWCTKGHSGVPSSLHN